MTNLGQKLEILANVAIVVVAAAVVTVVYRDHQQPTRPARGPEIEVGATAPVKGVDWASKRKTLVLALSTQCHYCQESSPFYKSLSDQLANRKDLGFVSVFPQSAAEAEKYLREQGIRFGVVSQNLGSIPIAGTPTLLLVDQRGKVTKKWSGRLPADGEASVWKSLDCRGPEDCS